ncbi:MAG: site-specific integrase [Rhodothermales bacterium]
MWLNGKSANTVEAYTRDVSRFLRHTGRSLSDVRLEDIQDYAASLEGLAADTRARKLAAVKSLGTFAHEIGYSRFNARRAVKLPNSKNELAEQIPTES